MSWLTYHLNKITVFFPNVSQRAADTVILRLFKYYGFCGFNEFISFGMKGYLIILSVCKNNANASEKQNERYISRETKLFWTVERKDS